MCDPLCYAIDNDFIISASELLLCFGSAWELGVKPRQCCVDALFQSWLRLYESTILSSVVVLTPELDSV